MTHPIIHLLFISMAHCLCYGFDFIDVLTYLATRTCTSVPNKPFGFCRQIRHTKSRGPEIHLRENSVIQATATLSQYTRGTEGDTYGNSRTLQCNCIFRLKTDVIYCTNTSDNRIEMKQPSCPTRKPKNALTTVAPRSESMRRHWFDVANRQMALCEN